MDHINIDAVGVTAHNRVITQTAVVELIVYALPGIEVTQQTVIATTTKYAFNPGQVVIAMRARTGARH